MSKAGSKVLVLTLLLFAVASQGLAEEPGICLSKAARSQVGVTTGYDGAYTRIPYPNGDVARDRGVCTDVVIRAYRTFGVDLQVLVHEDMKHAWAEYPNPWHMKTTDSNIDHRRVPNLAAFFRRHGQVVSDLKDPKTFQAGDIVTWQLAPGVPHIGIVSDQRSESGTPLMIHNIGEGVREEDVLFAYTITGHYRYLPDLRDLSHRAQSTRSPYTMFNLGMVELRTARTSE